VASIAGAMMMVGSLLALVATIGLHRFPDVLARMHAATKPATLGLILILAGASLRLEDTRDIAKLALIALFQFTTAPIAAHLVGRAAYRTQPDVGTLLSIDQLAADEAGDGPDPG
jgi:multicomponent Na+:H+ antiporter subunit G